ncbi:hypothetical protein BKP37_17030 [Anaerobacillus alkalilacustris]|uniref:MobA-like NTP transferase domain-containing protein n=1 Tax=Anaerobacillus alkalilacustris TaxID=393763 RepID=A0A1S2LF10_9BACI|nr:nucleotidyltransferase family protein [Anaerobacillus alkalilacustris]OIJ11112.1 hypothetical protein BKP37_17030 [Anaerobacillus alkalilacustris]
MNERLATILAAGCSSRMGTLKQLLPLNDIPVLQHVIEKILVHPFYKIQVIVGYEAWKIKSSIAIDDSRIEWIYNPHYEQGLSTSFLTAFHSLSTSNSAVMFFLGDQPFIDSRVVSSIFQKALVVLNQTTDPFVIRPVLDKKPGHPVLFGHFQSLDLTLVKGDSGGKELINSIRNKILIPLTSSSSFFDIDTPEDYKRARRQIRL